MIGIFLDTETNGLNPHKHCILEIAYQIINVETGEIVTDYEAIVSQSPQRWAGSDPHSLMVNGFTWEKTKSGLQPEEISGAIITSFAKAGVARDQAVFICQNPSFDRAFFSQLIDPDLQESLGWPYHWLDLASMYWALRAGESPTPWETGVSKDKISEVLGLEPEEKPHKAMNGVKHLVACYEALVGYKSQLRV